MKMGEGKERYLNLTFEETGSTYIYMYWRYLNLTFEETGSTVTTNAQIVSDRQLVRNEYWYKIYCNIYIYIYILCMMLRGHPLHSLSL